jgi:hypothetical protein
LEKLVEEDNDEGGSDKLNDEQKANTSTEIAWLPVKTCQNVYGSLAE